MAHEPLTGEDCIPQVTGKTGYDLAAQPGRLGGTRMILEALGSAVLGIVLAWAAVHRLSHRLPATRLVFATGIAGALFGDFVTHSALDSGSLLVSLLGAAVVSAASVSLLLRPSGRLRHSATA
jgi:hypothetical protein